MKSKKSSGRVGRPRNAKTDAVSKRLGVTKRQAEKLVRRGVTTENLQDIESARLAKLKAEIEMLVEKLAILQRDHVSAAQVREDALRACSIFKAELASLEIQLPPLLEGLEAKKMRAVIGGHVGRILKELCERLATIP